MNKIDDLLNDMLGNNVSLKTAKLMLKRQLLELKNELNQEKVEKLKKDHADKAWYRYQTRLALRKQGLID